jgi:hypothetical protein
VDADPVGVTAWTQPWIPLWLEWQVEVDDEGAVGDWQLGGVDLIAPDAAPGAPTTLVYSGRSLLAPGPATGLSRRAGALARRRALARSGVLEPDRRRHLRNAVPRRDLTDQLDVVSAALEDYASELLGLPWDNGLVGPRRQHYPGRPAASRCSLVAPPDPGAPRRRLPVGCSSCRSRRQVPTRVATADDAAVAGLPPRLLVPSRAMFRFVGAASTDER